MTQKDWSWNMALVSSPLHWRLHMQQKENKNHRGGAQMNNTASLNGPRRICFHTFSTGLPDGFVSNRKFNFG
jgi:hypothetical protein